jgi:non-specific protein-tyrosine kinase
VSLFLEEAMTDQLKILRTKVMNKMEQIGGNSLLVTSANPQEGKTLTAINLAVSISHKVDHTVLLVDANLRTPSIHHYFGLDIDKGLSDYLLLQADLPDLLLNPGIDKLVILPAGKPLPNSADLLGAPRMESLVREMKARYSNRFIIFDSPSLLYSADPLVCSRFTDAILMVVESEKSSTKDLEQVCELLKDRVLIGSVLNKAKH